MFRRYPIEANLKKIYIVLLIFISLSNFACTKHKFLAAQDIKQITLKLSKDLDVQLEKLGKSNTNFNVLAKVKSPNIVIDATITWIVSDSNDQVLLKVSNEQSINQKEFEIESENFNLPSEDENYKIVFIFNGRTSAEDINKTSIYYSKNQDDIDKAILDLQDRANN